MISRTFGSVAPVYGVLHTPYLISSPPDPDPDPDPRIYNFLALSLIKVDKTAYLIYPSLVMDTYIIIKDYT